MDAKTKVIGALVLAALIAVPTLLAVLSEQNFTGNAVALPAYATRHPLIKEAYIFAVENPDALDGVNCYCGCMHHPHGGRVHKRGLLDCFRTENGGFDPHASECDMCIKDALQVKQMTEGGIDKETIKQTIDSKYAG